MSDLADIEMLIGRLILHVEAAEHSHALPRPCGIDIRFGLDPTERDRINAILDERETAQLLHAQAGGHA